MKPVVIELCDFAKKQAEASVFGALLLGFIIFTMYVDLPGLHRYDYIFIYAVLLQVILVFFKLETKREVLVILVFHIVAT
jgi:uncharacterized membrane protein YoaT (DUF817 family)